MVILTSSKLRFEIFTVANFSEAHWDRQNHNPQAVINPNDICSKNVLCIYVSMKWCGGGGVLCASTWWDHRESNNLQHPVYNIRWQIRDSSPHHPIHFSNQHIKTMFLKHFSGLKKEDSEPLLALRTNSFISFSYLSFIGIQWFFYIFWTEKLVVNFVFTFFTKRLQFTIYQQDKSVTVATNLLFCVANFARISL